MLDHIRKWPDRSKHLVDFEAFYLDGVNISSQVFFYSNLLPAVLRKRRL